MMPDGIWLVINCRAVGEIVKFRFPKTAWLSDIHKRGLMICHVKASHGIVAPSLSNLLRKLRQVTSPAIASSELV